MPTNGVSSTRKARAVVPITDIASGNNSTRAMPQDPVAPIPTSVHVLVK